MSKILFSPIGGTDPISEKNYREGGLLHICRFYTPDKIIMYMSKEIVENHRKDNRYVRGIEYLYESLNLNMPEIEIIEKDMLTEVHRFDIFYDDFRKILLELKNSVSSDDEILINVSSGTPGMKSALQVLATLGEFPMKVIQVSNPTKKMGEHIHNKEYSIELYWEFNEDNCDYQTIGHTENRCAEIKCNNLLKIKYEEIIKKQICDYNYSAAYELAQELNQMYGSLPYLDLIAMAYNRNLFLYNQAKTIAKNNDIDCFPIATGNYVKMFESALNLQIKLARHEYADFVRAITPLFVQIFETILKEKLNVNLTNYINIGWDEAERWNMQALLSEERLLSILDKKYDKNQDGAKKFKGGIVYSDALVALIDGISTDQELKNLANDLRSVEAKLRNKVAHQLMSVTEDVFKQETGFTSEQIMKKIKQLFNYMNVKVKKDDWKAYDVMNDKILKAMEAID